MAPNRPATEVTLTMAPVRRCRMPGSTSRMQRTAPLTLTLNTSDIRSVVASSTTAFPPTPALLTSTSTRPAALRISPMPFLTDLSSATSMVTSLTATPASAHMASNFPARPTSRTVPYTSWPLDARWMAVARPMPELAPVTTLTVIRPPRSGGLLQDVDAAGRAQPDDVGQSDLGPLDLPVATLTAEVGAHLPDVGDAGGRDRMALRLKTAGHVDRQPAVAPRSPRLEEVDGPALLAQHQVVVVDQLGRREAVVELDQVEVVGTDAGLLVGLLGRVAGESVDVGQDLARLLPRIGGEHRSADLDRPPLLLLGERLKGRAVDDHGRGGPVTVGRAHWPG